MINLGIIKQTVFHNNRTWVRGLILWICLGFIVCHFWGCARPAATERRRAAIQPPASWATQRDANSEEPDLAWQPLFDDPRLIELIREALEQNYDLKIAATRIDSMLAEAMLAGATRWPTFNAQAMGQKGKVPVEALDRVSTEDKDSTGVSLALSWELDLWGRLKDQSAAATNAIQAVTTDYQAARLSLAGQVAKAWYQIIADQMQLQLMQNTLKNYQTSARIVRRHFESGMKGALDLRLALSNVAMAENIVQVRTNHFIQSKRHLQILLQRYPDGIVDSIDKLPPMGRPIPAGLPSQILERRPDIRAAKQRLLGADLRISVAKKAFLPNIQLTGDTGTVSKKLKNVLNMRYGFWNLVANLTQPLLDGGNLQANLSLAESEAQRAWLHYANTIQIAFAEVERTLTGEDHLIKRIAALRNTVHQAQGAEELAVEAYVAGLTDFVTILEAQRRLLDAKADLINVRQLQLQNRVDIYLALGGHLYGILEE